MKRIHLFVVLSLLSAAVGRAQTITYAQAMNELNLMRSTFNTDTSTYASCQVMYYYSMESTPTTYLDSLTGQYKMTNGNHLYVRIGNTETIQGDSTVAILYNDDSTLLATQLTPGSSPTPGGESLFLLDSSFVAYNTDSITLSTQGGFKTMAFYFTDSSRFYNCKLVYSASSYIPSRLSYILRSSKIPDAGQPIPDGALVTLVFSGYSTAPFDKTLLDPGRYYTIDANGVVTLKPAYSNYTLVQTANFKVGDN